MKPAQTANNYSKAQWRADVAAGKTERGYLESRAINSVELLAIVPGVPEILLHAASTDKADEFRVIVQPGVTASLVRPRDRMGRLLKSAVLHLYDKTKYRHVGAARDNSDGLYPPMAHDLKYPLTLERLEHLLHEALIELQHQLTLRQQREYPQEYIATLEDVCKQLSLSLNGRRQAEHTFPYKARTQAKPPKYIDVDIRLAAGLTPTGRASSRYTLVVSATDRCGDRLHRQIKKPKKLPLNEWNEALILKEATQACKLLLLDKELIAGAPKGAMEQEINRHDPAIATEPTEPTEPTAHDAPQVVIEEDWSIEALLPGRPPINTNEG